MLNAHAVLVDGNKCIGCGLCKKDCPSNNISLEQKKAVIRMPKCTLCGHCVAVCPKSAISMTGFEEEPKEIKTQICLDSRELLEAIQNRRSIRQYENRDVSEDIINQIIEAGRLTPTAKNTQDVSYVVLKDKKEEYEQMAIRFFKRLLPFARFFYPGAKNVSITEDFFFKKAPIAIVIIAKDKINGALAASNMELMAESFGLGVLYSGLFSMAANHITFLKKAFHLKHDKVVTTLVLGYPNVMYYRTVQKENAIVQYL